MCPLASNFLVVFLLASAAAEYPTSRQILFNPCDETSDEYATKLTDCMYTELPPHMTERYTSRFKDFVNLDDEGVLKLLCRSIDFKGDVLVNAFADEYEEESEQELFLEAVEKCHVMVTKKHHNGEAMLEPITKKTNGKPAVKRVMDSSTMAREYRN